MTRFVFVGLSVITSVAFGQGIGERQSIGPEIGLLIAGQRQDYVHTIPPVALEGCTETEVAHAREFSESRARAFKEGLISGRALIYAYMLEVESLACAGRYAKDKYCAMQSDYLARLEKLYRGAAQPDVARLPLPGHHIVNTMALRTRCR